jgi:subtilisin family serine protease
VFDGIQSGESDAFAELSYGPQLIHANLAHQISTGKNVPIAVIDTGADKEHPDLKGRFAKTVNFVEGGEMSFTKDIHGTAVSGVIGARANDGIGIYGIAPDSKINLYKACAYSENDGGKAECSSWSLAKAVDAAINDGTKIINLSLAGPHDQLLEKLLTRANQQEISIVAASLEKQQQPGFPANLPFVIPVISVGPEGTATKPTWLSAYPSTVAAPGKEILTTVPNEGYDFVSGSSLATAHISGIIALLLERKPSLTAAEIQKLIKDESVSSQALTTDFPDVCELFKKLGLEQSC